MFKSIFCQTLKDQQIDNDRFWSYNSAICSDIFISDLSIELSQEVKVLLEVCGQYSLNDKEAKTLELHVIQVDQKVELWPGQIEAPSRRSVVVLQHWPVIIQHGLHSTRGKNQVVREGKDASLRRFLQFPLKCNICAYIKCHTICNGFKNSKHSISEIKKRTWGFVVMKVNVTGSSPSMTEGWSRLKAGTGTKKGLKDAINRCGGCQHCTQSIGSGFLLVSFKPLSWDWDTKPRQCERWTLTMRYGVNIIYDLHLKHSFWR